MSAAQTPDTRYRIPDAHPGGRSLFRLRMIWAALVALTLVVAGMSVPARYQQLRRTSPLLPPVAISLAILRYRLWDIEGLINRTLVYIVLTTAQGLVYLVSVVLLQAFFRTVTGQTSQLAIVTSTLTIATLFAPLRRGVQLVIDRRFYRRKYDAAKVLVIAECLQI